MTLGQTHTRGTVVLDYALGAFRQLHPQRTEDPRPPQAIPPTAHLAVDLLIADTLERNLPPQQVTRILEAVHRASVLFALRRAHGNQRRAAAMLGMNRITFKKWCMRFQMDPSEFGGTGQPINFKKAA
ncbi:hypothetical protein HYPGJ_31589 [Hyphomicrobium sp. GJ21]|uniref:helix-turn-helix domain-containing protein n=1 Tax=Hyphomicrobium sp. GJ21 TaxID=113574 RepID=UPI00041AD0EA|nr:helix-turn-helix domain-containing protein [Hyphomicrobium sp. GJ21]CEJ88093.1 hypothetical protein HYPGJ_31589 [Hyphomicrobium sp. GJ21]